MSPIDWSNTLDLARAAKNLRDEMVGDWHQDPWGWPEIGFLASKEPGLVYSHAQSNGSNEPALIDVPKENWATRPAVVLDVLDRITYQALVDRLSVKLIGHLTPNAFGWRLPPDSPKPGQYSKSQNQWAGYRRHLSRIAGLYPVALKTDLVSCFASISISAIQDAIQDRGGSSAVTERLCSLTEGFGMTPGRSGLPQRSSASAVLANMFLTPLDDLMLHHSIPTPRLIGSSVQYRSYARWMDDIWLSCSDGAEARRAQFELEEATRSLGLQLNYAKTDVLEGGDVTNAALDIEQSAVDLGIMVSDLEPLELLADRILEEPEKASRTAIRFLAHRMREHEIDYRLDDLLDEAPRMPQGADWLSRLFAETYSIGALQDWYLDYVESKWAMHQWTVAHFGRMFPSHVRPRKKLREFFADSVRDANTSLPLLAVGAQRLSQWDPPEARSALRDAFRRAPTCQTRRVIALTALGVGESRTMVRRWLKRDKETYPTLRMLEEFGWRGPKVQADFAGHPPK